MHDEALDVMWEASVICMQLRIYLWSCGHTVVPLAHTLFGGAPAGDRICNGGIDLDLARPTLAELLCYVVICYEGHASSCEAASTVKESDGNELVRPPSHYRAYYIDRLSSAV